MAACPWLGIAGEASFFQFLRRSRVTDVNCRIYKSKYMDDSPAKTKTKDRKRTEMVKADEPMTPTVMAPQKAGRARTRSIWGRKKES